MPPRHCNSRVPAGVTRRVRARTPHARRHVRRPQNPGHHPPQLPLCNHPVSRSPPPKVLPECPSPPRPCPSRSALLTLWIASTLSSVASLPPRRCHFGPLSHTAEQPTQGQRPAAYTLTLNHKWLRERATVTLASGHSLYVTVYLRSPPSPAIPRVQMCSHTPTRKDTWARTRSQVRTCIQAETCTQVHMGA